MYSKEIIPILLVALLSFFRSPCAAQTCELELSSLFEASSNSTSSPTQNGPELVLDQNENTWWQSEDDVEPVLMKFTSNVSLSGYKTTAGIIVFQGSLPEILSIYTQGFQQRLRTYAVDCTELFISPCLAYDVTVGNDTSMVFIQIDTTLTDLSLVMSGFQNNSTHYEILQVTIRGIVVSEYYLHGLHSVKAEGEDGILLSSESGFESLVLLSNQNEFPGFSSHGYVNLAYGSEDVKVQWILILEHTTSYENLVIRYSNNGIQSYWFRFEVMQGSKMCDIRFRIESKLLCSENCYSPAEILDAECESADQTLDAGTVTMIAQLSNANFLLDYITAIPDDFNVADNCDLVHNSLGNGTGNEDCVCSVLQLSLDIYKSPSSCTCNSKYSNSSCVTLGGQCFCSEGEDDDFIDPLGQQCNICPLYYYLVDQGCEVCGCPDDSICDENGQCPCGDLITGRTCDRCIDGYFGIPPVCQACDCDIIGSALTCDNINGTCICAPNVNGMNCAECISGFYNFSGDGCDACECYEPGSEGEECDSEGNCVCKDGFTGSKCNQCLDDYFMSIEGCSYCNCSGRTLSCTQHPNVTDVPFEFCNCPAEYRGDSCQFCSDGHYLTLDNECVACDCNNSFNCNNITGECFIFPVVPPPISPPPPPPPLNCTPNTTGDLCDICADGYYNGASDPDNDLICYPCPCNTNTSVNGSCDVINTQPVCYCLPGHDGTLCDTCSPGYYGIPPLFPCSSCNCSGNIDPTDENACNHTTGQCLICLNNSTGPDCGVCADGYYGDATQQNCQACNCNSDGSLNDICDKMTGICTCLPGVIEDKCTQCQIGYWGFQSGFGGCVPCDCDSTGSNSTDTCDVNTGQCSCKFGVSGRRCDYCEDEFFNFTDSGCQECDCTDGSLNNSCHVFTGQCPCTPGATGRQCDQCIPYHQIINGKMGCQPCDDCVSMLQLENDELIFRLNEVDVLAQLSAELQDTDTLNLEQVLLNVNELWSLYNMTADALLYILSDFYGFQVDNTTLYTNFNIFNEMNKNISQQAQDVEPLAGQTLTDITALHNSLEYDFDESDDTLTFLMNLKNRLELLVTPANDRLLNIAATADLILAESFSGQLYNYTNIYNSIISTRDSISAKFNQAILEEKYISYFMQNASMLEDVLYVLNHTLIASMKSLAIIEDGISEAEWKVDDLTVSIEDINGTIAVAESMIDQSEYTLTSVEETLEIAKSDISLLELLIDDISASGSGYVDGDSDSLSDLLARLNDSISQLISSTEMSVLMFTNAIAHGNEVNTEAERVCSVLDASLNAGNEAIDAIIDYRGVNTTITQALSIVNTANYSLTNVLWSVDELMATGINDNITELLSSANNLILILQQLSNTLNDLKTWYLYLYYKVDHIETVVTDLISDVEELEIAANNFVTNTEVSISNIKQNLAVITVTLYEANNTYQTMFEDYTELVTESEYTSDLLDDITQSVFEIEMDALEANGTAAEAFQSFSERVTILNDIEEISLDCSSELTETRNSVNDLRWKLLEAQRAAASIDVALRFSGNNSANYSLTVPSDNEGTYISLLFRPEVLSGTLLLSGNLNLGLVNGDLEWTDGDSSIKTNNLSLTNTDWYQVYASSEGNSRQLSVAPLQGSVDTITIVEDDIGSMTTSLDSMVTLAGAEEASFFSGCIDKVIVNGESLSLLTPDTSLEPIIGCGPRPAAEIPRDMEMGAWFQGRSQLKFSPIDFNNGSFSLSLYFRTFSNSSLLFWAGNNQQNVSLIISNGVPTLDLSLNAIHKQYLHSEVFVSDGEWHYATILIEDTVASINIDGEMRMLTLDMFAKPLLSPVELYLGGYDESIYQSYAGCIRSVSVDNIPLNMSSNVEAERVKISNCPTAVTPGIRFMGTGGAIFPGFGFFSFVSLSFRTDQIAAVLAYMSAPVINGNPELPDQLTLTLFHTYVRLDYVNFFIQVTVLSEQRGLNDLKWHSVSVQMDINGVHLTVDGVTVTYSTDSNDQLLLFGDVIIGSLPSSISTPVPVSENFRGCMRNLYINEELYDFNDALSLEGVGLYGCHGDIDPTPTPVSPSMSVPIFITPSPSIISSGFVSGEDLSPIVPDSSTDMLVSPVITSSVPVTTSSVPVTTSSVPMTMSSVILTTSSVPVTTSSVPMSMSSVILTTSSVPVTTSSVPMSMSSVILTTSSVPVTTSSVPMSMSSVILTTSSVPVTTSSVPMTMSSVILTTSSVPVTTSSVPMSMSSVILTTSSVPVTTSSVPMSMSSVILTTSSVPVTTSSVPMSMSSDILTTSSLPVTTSSVPIAVSSDILTTFSLPDATSSVPMSMSNDILTTSSLPVTTSSVPMSMSSVILTTSSVPVTTSSVPMSMSSDILTTSSLPVTTSSVPMSMSSDILTTFSLPVTTSNVPISVSSDILTTSSLPDATSSVPMSMSSDILTTFSLPVTTSSVPMSMSSDILTTFSLPVTTSSVPISVSSDILTTSSLPVTTSSVPISVSSHILTTFSLPDATSSVPMSMSSDILTTSSVPVTTSSVPMSMSSDILTTSSLPVTTSSVPMTMSSVQMTTSSVPVTTSSVPMSVSSVILTTSSLPVTTSFSISMSPTISSVPMTTSSVPMTMSSVQMTTSSLPMTTSSVPMTTSVSSSVPLTTSSVPMTTSVTTSSVPMSTSVSSSVPMTMSSPSPSPSPVLPVGLDGHNNSFLCYSISSFDITERQNITLVFRTVSNEAILLYTQGSTYVDHLALEIKSGYLRYSFNLGAGTVFINTSPKEIRVDDDNIHTVSLLREEERGSLVVDGVWFNDSSPPNFIQLNTERNPLYIGGVSQGFSVYSLIGNSQKIPPGALACFYSLEINGNSTDLMDLLSANGKTDCQSSYDDHISFRGDGYAELETEYNPGVNYGFELEFRTLNCSGLLLYSSSYFLSDHTALELSEGSVRFVFDNGGGVGIVEYTPTNLLELCDGEWHKITANKDGVIGTLVVDNNEPELYEIPNSDFQIVNVDAPLYAGGVPESLLLRYTVFSDNFQGCIRDLQLINRGEVEYVHFSQVSLSSPDSVQLYTCSI